MSLWMSNLRVLISDVRGTLKREKSLTNGA
jgi:hypothetical protein